jgi:adenylate cyclase
MGLAMQTYVDTLSPRSPDLRLRNGSHTGSVVAAVIGENRFAYHLWGDDVNIASRLESYGLPGWIHVSETFVRAASDKWHFGARGLIEARHGDCP